MAEHRARFWQRTRYATVSVQANAATASRAASVAIGTQVVPVAQAGSVEVAVAPPPPADPCASLRLQREGDQVAPTGLTGPVGFSVVVDVGCEWQAENKVPWLRTHRAGGFGKGNGVVNYLVEPNGDPAKRNGTIVISANGIVAKTFTVNQIGSAVQTSGGDSGGDGGGGDGGDGGGGSSGGSSG